ncbi:hypothetical protein CPB86DRAFT_787459 [Serendipita vermifera]|nr:hypothetical protein CPB86DRAFT_787459 [Serendipita vermifera]
MSSTQDLPHKNSKDQPRESTRFHRGYGDFTFMSIDNVIFSFPRGVLTHVSPVFNDMFQSGSSDQEPDQPIVQLQEDHKTLTHLLHLIDPLLQPLPIEKATLRGLLEAGRKYQISKVLQWVESKVIKGATVADSPLFYLSLGYQFESKEMARRSMREAIRCNIQKLTEREEVSGAVLQQLLVARAQRSALLSHELLGVIVRTAQELNIGGNFGSEMNNNQISPPRDRPRPKSCKSCNARLRVAIKTVSTISIIHPSVGEVDKEFKSSTYHRCTTCGTNIYQAIWERPPNTMMKQRAIMDTQDRPYKMTYQETLQDLKETEKELPDVHF